MLSQLQGVANVHLSIAQEPRGTSLAIRSVPSSEITHWHRVTLAAFFKQTACSYMRRLAPATAIKCSAFEQEVPLPSNQGVWKQPVTPQALQPVASNTVKADSPDPRAALSKAIEVLRDIEGLSGGQKNVGETVADIVELLEGLKETQVHRIDSDASAEAAASSNSDQAPSHSEPPTPDALGGIRQSEQSENNPHEGSIDTALQVVSPTKPGGSVTNFLKSIVPGVLSFLRGSGPKSVGATLGGILLTAVLGTVGTNLPVKSPIPLPKIAPTVSVPYSHFLSHVNYDVIDKVEMVGQQVLYKLRDDVVYNPGSYKPEQELLQALSSGVATLLRLRKGGSLDDAVLKTTLPAGHTLPLNLMVDNNVTLKARQPNGAPQSVATVLAALLAGYYARKGMGPKGAKTEPAKATNAQVASDPLLLPASPDLPIQTQPPEIDNVGPSQSPPPLEKSLPPTASLAPNALSWLFKRFSENSPSPSSAPQQPHPDPPTASNESDRQTPLPSETPTNPLRTEPAIEQGARAGTQSKATMPGESFGTKPGEAESVPGVSLTGSTGQTSPGVSQQGARDESPSSTTGIVVTFVNETGTKAVLYATNPVQSGTETGVNDKMLHVAWKVFDPQKSESFDIGPRPPEVGAIRRESPTKTDRAGPFLTEMGAIWGMVQRSKAHTPMLKEGTPADFWYRFRENDVVSVVNVRPAGIHGPPYEFGFYQAGELVLLAQAKERNEVVRFQVPKLYTFGALKSNAAGVRKGGLLDIRTDLEPSVLTLTLDEHVEKHIQVTLSKDSASAYKWDVKK